MKSIISVIMLPHCGRDAVWERGGARRSDLQERVALKMHRGVL